MSDDPPIIGEGAVLPLPAISDMPGAACGSLRHVAASHVTHVAHHSTTAHRTSAQANDLSGPRRRMAADQNGFDILDHRFVPGFNLAVGLANDVHQGGQDPEVLLRVQHLQRGRRTVGLVRPVEVHRHQARLVLGSQMTIGGFR